MLNWIKSFFAPMEKSKVVLHCMVDLETLATTSNAYIRSIGACFFDASGVRPMGFYESCDGPPQPGAYIDPGTVEWWDRQSKEAKEALFNLRGHDLETILHAFRHWVDKERSRYAQNEDYSDVEVWMWGNGGDFDPVVLRNAYMRTGIECPWPWYTTRCFRTLKATHKNIPAPKNLVAGPKHHALTDAIVQAGHAVMILRRIYW